MSVLQLSASIYGGEVPSLPTWAQLVASDIGPGVDESKHETI